MPCYIDDCIIVRYIIMRLDCKANVSGYAFLVERLHVLKIRIVQ